MEVQPYRSRSRSRSRHGSRSSSRRPSMNKSHSSSSLSKLNAALTALSLEREVPSTNATLDNTLPLDFFKQDILSLTRKLYIKKWWKKNLSIDQLSINRISGALTNCIYKLTYPNLPSLLLRIYGKNVDNIIDRDCELKILIKLSSKNIGPKLLGIFANGRFEQFLEGYLPLDKESIRDEVISQILARRMKDLHYKIELDDDMIGKNQDLDSPKEQAVEASKLNVDEDERNGLLNEKLTGSNESSNKCKKSPDNGTKPPSTHSGNAAASSSSPFPMGKFTHPSIILPMSWKLIKKWFEILKTDYLPIYQQLNYNLQDIFKMDLCQFESIVNLYFNWLLSKYETDLTNFKFCHNDTQYGNLLLHKNFNPQDIIIHDNVIKSTSTQYDNNLAVIDFEYSGANFPAFDIVNHFSEWMSDYYHETEPYHIFEENYPNQLQIFNFLKSYIEYEFQFPSSKLKANQPDSLTPSLLIQYEIRKLYNECIYWRPAVQIYWFLWGLIQNGIPKSSVESPKEQVKNSGINGEEYMVTVNNLDQEHISDDDEDISNSIDEFDYLKYANQKMNLILGDLIQLKVINKTDIDEKYWQDIKYLDTKDLDLN